MQTLRRNESLWHNSEDSSNFHFVIHGRLKLTHVMQSGREIMLDMIEVGDLACGPAVCTSRDYCCDAISATDSTRVLVVPQQDLFGALFGGTPAAQQFVERMSTRALSGCRRFVEVSGRAVDQRVAALFLRLSREHGVAVGDGGSIRMMLVLSRKDIAQLCATTVETASRTMTRLAHAQVVTTLDDGFLVDARTLRRQLDEDPDD